MCVRARQESHVQEAEKLLFRNILEENQEGALHTLRRKLEESHRISQIGSH